MHLQIKFLIDILNNIDSNPQQSMQFITSGGCKYISTSPSNLSPSKDCRWTLIGEILHKSQHIQMSNDNCGEVDMYITDIFTKLNDVYQHSQQYCWKSHEHHFHTNFEQYVNCPVTCISEISEYLERTLKEMYNG
jgi:hypothetical protein